jgi:hypothetical protein
VVTFNNGNPPGSAITGMHFVNEDAQTMIMTASGTLSPFGHLPFSTLAHVSIKPRELSGYSATMTCSDQTILWKWSHLSAH